MFLQEFCQQKTANGCNIGAGEGKRTKRVRWTIKRGRFSVRKGEFERVSEKATYFEQRFTNPH